MAPHPHQDSTEVFLQFVKACASGKEPANLLVEKVWDRLRGFLMYEIRRRGLWNSPPTYLGVVGYPSWSDTALDELVTELFSYVFIDRLRHLMIRAQTWPDLTGLVRHLVRDFVSEIQRRHDRIGYRVFQTLRTSIQMAVDRGELFILDDDQRLRSSTTLAFSTRATLPEPALVDLREKVLAFTPELLPDLVVALGPGARIVKERLMQLILALRNAGVMTFQLGQIATPMQEHIRAAWSGIWHQEPLSNPLSKVIELDRTFEDRMRFEKLVDGVGKRLLAAKVSAKDRAYLQNLWGFLLLQADSAEENPSERRLAEFLGIPRARIAGLLETLRGFVRDCEFERPEGDFHPGVA